MKKKGFTLIEIIVCIIILAIIGVSSFVGIKTITKNIRIDKLEQITDRALQAAEVYIETNKESFNQLYNKKNSVVVPLNTLINEGLLDLKGTTLEDKDIENEYVVTAFTGNNPKENCIDITSNASWNLSKDNPFYICSNEDGTSNSIIIGGTTNNKDTILKERTYLNDYNRNYVSYLGGIYRILYIESDDSLVLYTEEDTFGDKFIGKTQPMLADNCSDYSTCNSLNYVDKYFFEEYETAKKYYYTRWDDTNTKTEMGKEAVNIVSLGFSPTLADGYLLRKEKNVTNNEQFLTYKDAKGVFTISTKPFYILHRGVAPAASKFINIDSVHYFVGTKIQLKSCIKVSTGIGTTANPYVLDDSSC